MRNTNTLLSILLIIFFSVNFSTLKAEETCNGHLAAVKIFDQATDAPVPGIPPIWLEMNGNSPSSGPDIDIDLLPANYYIGLEVGGNIIAASIVVDGVSQNCENIMPLTFPNGAESGVNWNGGLGTHTLDISLYHISGCNSEICDGLWDYSFDIIETPDDCAGAPAICSNPCARTTIDTDNCNTGNPYQTFLVDCCGVSNRLTTISSTWEECDGAIHYSGTFEWIGSGCEADAYDVITFDVVYYDATTTPPADSPRAHSCEPLYDPTGWVYYPSLCGTMTSSNHGTFDLSPSGSAFQVGNGANVTGTLDYGASGWIHVSGGDGHYTNGDFNIMLGSEECTVIPPTDPTCTGCFTYFNETQEKLINDDQIVLDLPQSEFGGAVTVDINEAISWDGYTNRVNADQPFEQWKLVFLKNGNFVAESIYTTDLEDFVASAEEISDLGTVTLPNGADQVLIVSYENAQYGEGSQPTANSVVPSSFCLACTPMNGTVSGHLFEDTNGDGIQGPGEPDLAGVDIVITDSNGNTQIVTTDSDGNYSAEVPAGTTTTDIDESTLPAGVEQTAGTDPTTVEVVAGEDTFTDDDGFFSPGTVSGHLFEDTNGDGVQGPGEPDLAGVDIVITDSEGNMQTVTTGPDGTYSAVVPPGTTTTDIDESTLPADVEQTAGTDPTTVEAVAGEDTFTDDDGFFLPAEVSGHLFTDTNGDGVQDPGEPDLGGVDIVITDSNGNTQTVTTEPDGTYSAEVPPGTTTTDIDESTLPADVEQTAGTDPTTVEAVAGEDTFTDDDGFFTPAEVSGHLFLDTNGDGVQDPGEPDLGGVDIVITDSNGNTQIVTTEPDGTYSAEVPPGTTTTDIDESTLPAGVEQTAGTDPTTVEAVAGEDTFTDDDGFFTPGTVSGHLYIDTNGNGVQDPGEPDLAGVDVQITDANGNTQIVETDENGDWIATVPPGTTTADILEGDPQYPDGHVQTEGTDPTTVEAVAGNDTFTDNDGFYQPGTVSGHLFIDTDGDGVQGPNEPDLANVDVIITDSEGNMQTVMSDANGDWIATVPPGTTTADVDETDPDFPEDHVQTSGTDPTTVEAVAGEDTFTDNDGYYQAAEVFGHIYIDDNKNGVQDPGEPNVANLDVVITDSNGNMQTVTTNASGDWVATVPPGSTTADIDETDPQFPTGLSQSEGEDPTLSFAIAGESVDGGTDGYAECPDAPSALVEFNQYLCEGESVVYEVENPIPFAEYIWDFGPIAEPSQYVGTGPIEVFYNTPTTAGADVLLIVQAQNCPGKNAIVAIARVTEILDETTIETDEQVCADLTKTFEAGNVSPIGIYEWDFGPGATPATAFGAGPHDVVFADGGAQEVTLTATPDISEPFRVCPHVETFTFEAEDCVGTVRGNVSDDAGTPLEGVVLTLDDGDATTADLTTTTDADGNYEFLFIPVGDYTIVQEQPANYGSVSDEDATPEDADLGDDDGVVNNEIPVRVDSDEFDEDNDFVETPDAGSVAGNVSDDAGNPLMGVVLTLDDGDAATTDPTTTTNADGDYSFSNVPEGTYTLIQTQPENYTSVSDEDTSPEDPSVLDDDGIVNNEIPVKVDPGEDDVDNDFVESPDNGSVSGIVLDDAGEPIEGVVLTLDDGDAATMDPTATTGADGMYEFPDVPVGVYTVVEEQPENYSSVSDEDETPEDPSVSDNDGQINDEIPVKVEPGEADEDNNFVESPDPGSVSGIVEDTDGNPLAGVVVTLDDGDATTVDMTATTGADGTYEFPSVPVGDYTLIEEQPADYTSVSDEDTTPEDPSLGDDDGIVNDEIPVKVEPGEDDENNDFIEAPNAGSVSGTVLDDAGNPLEGVVLTLDDGDAATMDPTATTGADGTYEFPMVPAGEYTVVEEQPENYSSVSDEDTTPEDPSLGDDDGIVNDAIPVKVEAGEDDEDNDFVESPDNGSVSGTVLDDAGEPLEGVVLTLDDGNPATMDPTATTDATGAYMFPDVPVGDYTVIEEQPENYTSVSDEDTTPEDPSLGDDDGIVNDAIPVKVEPGEADDDNDFVESPDNGSVSGTVLDDAGEPIEGVVITLDDGDAATMDMTATTDATGAYMFPSVPVGDYTLVEEQPADYTSVSDEDTTPEDPSLGDDDGIVNDEIPVKVEPGEADDDNDFVETANAGSVSGTVVDQDGAGIEGVVITLDDGDAATMDPTATTDATGFYEFPVVPAGTYTLLEEQPETYLSVSDEDTTPEDPSIGDDDGITNDAIPVKVEAGEADDDNDFVEEIEATLIGHVYYDNNNNGVQDGDEPDLEGVAVTVVQSNGMTINLVTDENGDYATTILPGLTQVDVDNTDPQIAGATQTEGTDPQILTSFAATVNDAGNDGFYLPGNIFGKVSDDAGNPIEGVVITLDDGDAATTDLTTTTDADGEYEFLEVMPATYTIVETQPDLYTSVSDEDGTPEDPIVGDADGIVNDAIPVKLLPGEDDEDNDFIENLTAVFGHVYFDENNNGVQDLGEPNIPNVTVTITKSDLSLVVVETDENGDWVASVTPGLTEATVDETDPDFLAVVGDEYQQTEGVNPNTVAVPQGSLTDGGIDGYAGVPDITPIITFFPTNVTGVTDMFFTLRTQELISTPTNGLITLIFPRDERLTFDYDQGLVSTPIGELDNPDWTYDGSNESFHIWTSTTTIEALGSSTLGFFAQYDPQQSTGEVTFTVTIVTGSGTENNFLNNIDAETLDYFSGGQN